MSNHPQVALDPEGTDLVDEKIAPLVPLVRRHGLTVLESTQGDEKTPAHFVFADAGEGLEFILSTQHYMFYLIGERMVLTVLHPVGSDAPRAKVSWLPSMTHGIIDAWMEAYA